MHAIAAPMVQASAVLKLHAAAAPVVHATAATVMHASALRSATLYERCYVLELQHAIVSSPIG